MAKPPPVKRKPAPAPAAVPARTLFEVVKQTTAGFFKRRAAPESVDRGAFNTDMPNASAPDVWVGWESDSAGGTFLYGTANKPTRAREQIYQTWQDMGFSGVVASALQLHVTAALGGHESRGDMVFIEVRPDLKGNAEAEAVVEELNTDLRAMINAAAPTLALNACTFGDGYARMYGQDGLGIQHLYCDELVSPPMIQPYERAGQTVGFTLSTGNRGVQRLSIIQLLRMKMPRRRYIPQTRITEKVFVSSMREDDAEKLPVVQSMAGGSMLDAAEEPWRKFMAAMAGLVGQRVQDSVKQSLVGVQAQGMTAPMRKRLLASLKSMFESTNKYISDQVTVGAPVFTELFHMIPMSGEKQLVNIMGQTSSGRQSGYTVDDVMVHARLLGGALGVDISLIGFGDQMAGGLGEGGFFRISAHAGEQSRIIRAALTDALNHLCNVHLLLKHKVEYGANPPWQINFFSNISALETERAKTDADRMNAAALLVQTLQQMKDLALPKEAMAFVLEQRIGIDADATKVLVAGLEKSIAEAKKEREAQAGGGAFGAGGADGGGFDGGQDGSPDADPRQGLQPDEG
jgi:hypothetical protein